MQLKRRKRWRFFPVFCGDAAEGNVMGLCISSSISVPVDQIANARKVFPSAGICFEIEMAAEATWAAMQQICAIFAGSGAVLEAMKCSQVGHVFCRLRDDRGFDPTGISTALAAVPDLTLHRWTIVLMAARL